MKKSRTLVVVLSILLLTACKAGGNAATDVVDGAFTVTNVWSRTTPAVAQNGVFYMTFNNRTDTDEQLQTISADLCAAVELHEMYDKGEGLMGMRPVDGGTILIPAGETVKLHPGGLHIMCIGKDGEFNVGDTIPLTLQFANEGTVEVAAEVKASDD